MLLCVKHTTRLHVQYVHYVFPKITCLIFHFKPSAPAAEEQMKLPPTLHLAHGHPNGMRGNIRLVNSKQGHQPFPWFLQRAALTVLLVLDHSAVDDVSVSHLRKVRMTFIAPIKLL